MFTVDNLYDHVSKDVPTYPPFSIGDITLENPARFLTTHEVKQTTRNQTICEIGLVEENLDLERASRAVNHLMHLYPFLSYGVQFDAEHKWMRYLPQEVHTYNLAFEETPLSSFDEIGNYVAAATDVLHSQKLSHWSVVKIEVPELPTVRAGLVFKVYHCLMDGVAIMQLLKKFNELYVSASELLEIPSPIQVTNFRSIMSCQPDFQSSQQPLKKSALNLSKLTGQFKEENQFGSKLKYLDQIGVLCHHYRPEQICRVPGVQYSFSLYSLYITQLVAYMYFNKDLAITEDYVCPVVDLRRDIQLLQSGRYPCIDVNKILGQSALPCLLVSKGNQETSVQQIANQMQKQFEMSKTSSEMKWQQIAQNEVGPSSFKLNLDILMCSNIGKMDLGVGPVAHMIGFSSAHHIWEKPILYPANSVHSGKFGVFVFEGDYKLYSKDQQRKNDRVFIEMNRIIIKKGAENVTVSDIVKLYESVWK
ncbi:Conserved_hypothetical protein [Hexamita inflata]|uniref:Uncharacterized protein n=1 Tax=Hexamita inflata TaxID=28002 RepID=A0AA86Q3X9_9EUKA|nr:Conserved hypothetical protein [Hexamita inflata]